MVNIINIGQALLSHIEYNDKAPVKNIKDLIDKYKLSQDEVDNTNMYKKEAYKTKYESPRIENEMKYELYLKERAELVKKWNNDKGSRAKLLDVLNFKRPELADIEDIYSYQNIKLNTDKKTKVLVQNERVKSDNIIQLSIVEKSKKSIKEKECPPGKILNPITNRCITDKAIKKTVAKSPVEVAKPTVEVAKPAVEVAKPTVEVAKSPVEVAKPTVEVAEPAVEVAKPTVEVAEPAVEVAKPTVEVAEPAVEVAKPTAKKAIKEKECPPGKILNPITNRCITEKTVKKTIAKPSVEVVEPAVAKKAIKEKECPPGKILNPKTGRCINPPKK